MTNLPYRPCVGIALFNQEDKVFAGERIDTPGAWQMPQGGIDHGEEIQAAAFRELKEEIGTDKAEILKIHNEILRYTFPPDIQPKVCGGNYAGQDQTWIAMRFTGTDQDIDIEAFEHPEFSQWQWIEMQKLINLIVPFKRDVYQKIINAFDTIAV